MLARKGDCLVERVNERKISEEGGGEKMKSDEVRRDEGSSTYTCTLENMRVRENMLKSFERVW